MTIFVFSSNVDSFVCTFKKQTNTKELALRKRNSEVATKFVYNESWAGLRRCWEMIDLLHNRVLVLWWLSVMASFYAAMKCCILGSWKSGSTSTCLSVSLNVKYRQTRDQSILISRSVMENSLLILRRYKMNLFLLKVALKKLVGELETTIRVQKQRLQPASAQNF